MREVFDKLSIRTTDYVATIGVNNDFFLSKVADTVKGVMCVGRVDKKKFKNLEDVKVVDTVRQLDKSVFDKVIAFYSDEFRVIDLISAADHLGLVLVCNVPKDRRGVGFKLALKRMGIFEIWELKSDKRSSVDLLFKVRKYRSE